MKRWSATKASRVRAALGKIGWRRRRWLGGSHEILERGGSTYIWAFHDHTEIGPVMLAKIAKKTGLKPDDL